MPSKDYRQRLITELVENEFISTQAEIAERLAERGIKVTQATISRDVTELRLVRVPAAPGRHRYRATPLVQQDDVEHELRQRFKLFVRDLDRGENVIVVTTDDSVEFVSVEGVAERAPAPPEVARAWAVKYDDGTGDGGTGDVAEMEAFFAAHAAFRIRPTKAIGMIERPDEFAEKATRWVF